MSCLMAKRDMSRFRPRARARAWRAAVTPAAAQCRGNAVADDVSTRASCEAGAEEADWADGWRHGGRSYGCGSPSPALCGGSAASGASCSRCLRHLPSALSSSDCAAAAVAGCRSQWLPRPIQPRREGPRQALVCVLDRTDSRNTLLSQRPFSHRLAARC